jgi:hypothetical protein
MKKRVGRVVFASALTFFASSILLRAYGSHSIEWARQFGTPANEVADSIAVDRASGAEHFRASGAEHFRASGAEHFRASSTFAPAVRSTFAAVRSTLDRAMLG